ncbi:putative RNA-binding protein Jag [Abditibacterium utsteinense]|uniref:RNA-binding protein KhpB n=1 Tax=Abditibacterium utsteinense TaxID=1960156 RepID=A0A2S8SSK1_9BACT|nr:RNA-binding cell elongation regulator Jag/EloR [Abditibacterium utsteinense]PQV63792.1 putative RNA-binding protein Jag [Abditibacterium utsteinense]
MADKKFSPMRYTAATEESAINGALQIVGVARDEIDYDVLEQSEKGVTVRVKPRSTETPAPAAPIVVPTATSAEELSPIAEDVPELLAQVEEFDRQEAEFTESEAAEIEAPESEVEAQIGSEMDSLVGDFSEESPDSGVETEVESTEVESTEVESTEIKSAEIENIQLEVETEVAAPIIELDPQIVARVQAKAQELLDKMGLDAQVQLDNPKESNSAALIVDGEDVGILIGKHGATLQAFQYLLNLTLNAHLDGEEARRDAIRVVVDAGNYRARRQSSLEQTARSAASKARRDGRMVRLEPMPAHERRLVHLFLETEKDIVTQSEGREPMRRIVVSPATTSGSTSTSSAPRVERSSDAGSNRAGNRGGMGSFRRGDAQSERNRGLQRGR